MDLNLGVFEMIQLSVQHLSTEDHIVAQLVPPSPTPPAVGPPSPQVMLTGILVSPEAITAGTVTVGNQYEVILRPVAPVAVR
jgi:hypothetical protein